MNDNVVISDMVINLKDEFPDLDDHIQLLLPEIYNDGDGYCCLSGFNHINGIFGFGKTREAALKDWEGSYQIAKINGKI